MTSTLPSQSLAPVDYSPLPSATATHQPPTPTASARPGWPPGWDVDFCAMFGQAVIAQQLIVDVQRAIDDGATHDAKGLATELTGTASDATQLLEALPEWSVAQSAMVEIATLMDYGARAGSAYTTYFAHGAQSALRQAHKLRRQNQDEVPKANAELTKLADAGLSCPGSALTLESP